MYEYRGLMYFHFAIFLLYPVDCMVT